MTIDLQAIRAALEVATPGPFRRWKQRVCRADDKSDAGVFMAWNGEQDARLVMVLLNTAPALLSAAEENERLRAELDDARRVAVQMYNAVASEGVPMSIRADDEAALHRWEEDPDNA